MKFPSTTAPCLFLLSTLQQPAKIVASGATTGCDPTTPSLSSLANFTDNLRNAAASSPSVDTITCPAPGESDHSHKRVLLIGVDGLRADAAAMLPLPNLHRLSQMGTSTVRREEMTVYTIKCSFSFIAILTLKLCLCCPCFPPLVLLSVLGFCSDHRNCCEVSSEQELLLHLLP